ncbi:unnamed protein product [Microthlaspi erraticum]|uniref:Protein NIM1-INTERACTING 1 n=1 Tax=Microthlaspi erraticum TaxID=1685480 RepID=A0A6D2HHC9_9BRAS|nr:unnamed protein product [Microthlaspi erraticum]
MAMMNKEKETETNRINEIDDPEEDEETENKKMEMFFNLIRNYQEARKRRRQELTEEEDSGDAASDPRKRSDGGENSSIVPVFRTEDFSKCIDLNSKPSNSIVPTMNQEDEKEEEADKETREENGLDLNLAL